MVWLVLSFSAYGVVVEALDLLGAWAGLGVAAIVGRVSGSGKRFFCGLFILSYDPCLCAGPAVRKLPSPQGP